MEGDKSQTVTTGLKPIVDEMSKLPVTAHALAADAATDLAQTLGDLPDSSLISDWQSLCNEMREDVARTPEKTLADLENVRRRIVNSHNARMFYIGSTAIEQKLEPTYKTLLAGFDKSPFAKEDYGNERRIEARLAARFGAATPVYVGLMAPNMSGGVMMNSAKLIDYSDTSRDAILNFLASKLMPVVARIQFSVKQLAQASLTVMASRAVPMRD
jgi:hypothetical protein